MLLEEALRILVRVNTREGANCVPSRKKWRALIDAARDNLPPIISAKRYYQTWPTQCRPSLFACSDDTEYVVKGRENGRVLMNEHIVGVLGRAMGAPVPEVRLVYVPPELVDAEPELAHMTSGVAHGSRLIPTAIDKQGFHYGNLPENRPRFSHLARLFGLVFARDVQFLYDKPRPHVVYSVDHGEFFPGWGKDWLPRYLRDAPAPVPHDVTVAKVGLTGDELRRTLDAVKRLTDGIIARAVAGCRDEWGTTDSDRVDRAEYLATRRDEIVGRVAV